MTSQTIMRMERGGVDGNAGRRVGYRPIDVSLSTGRFQSESDTSLPIRQPILRGGSRSRRRRRSGIGRREAPRAGHSLCVVQVAVNAGRRAGPLEQLDPRPGAGVSVEGGIMPEHVQRFCGIASDLDGVVQGLLEHVHLAGRSRIVRPAWIGRWGPARPSCRRRRLPE